jgi:hypothetical protein
MEYKTITVQVLEVERINDNRDSYEDREKLVVADDMGHTWNLTRFRKSNENRIVASTADAQHWYMGFQKAGKKGYSDTFEEVKYVGNTPDGIVQPLWPEPPKDNGDKRQKSILVQSDMRTAAIISTQFMADKEDWWEQYANIYNRIKKFREEHEKT